jgi:hypothetical protein
VHRQFDPNPTFSSNFQQGIQANTLPGFNSMVPSTADLSRGSAAYKLRTAWVEGYLSDPCMFHAILYAASANLDLINKEMDNPVTAFHRGEAIRLTNETLARLDYHDEIPATIISATWALAHIAV